MHLKTELTSYISGHNSTTPERVRKGTRAIRHRGQATSVNSLRRASVALWSSRTVALVDSSSSLCFCCCASAVSLARFSRAASVRSWSGLDCSCLVCASAVSLACFSATYLVRPTGLRDILGPHRVRNSLRKLPFYPRQRARPYAVR
jgi:hypothetical protein